MFERLTNWLDQYDTVTIDGLEWPLQTRRQKLRASLRRGWDGMCHPLFLAVVRAVLSWLLPRN